MSKLKLIRITTVPISLEKLLEGQLAYMKEYYDITAISSDKQRLGQYGVKEGVETYHIEQTRKITPLKDLNAVLKLYKFLKREKPLIIHSHTPKAGIVGMTAAYFARVPLRLHTIAGLPLMEAKGVKKLLLLVIERLTYRFATNVYPNSKGLYDYILFKRLTSKKKVKVLGQGSSNGIDTKYFSREHFSETDILQKRNEYNIPANEFVYVFVGRIVKDKGIDELVSAFTELQKREINCTLLLVGPFEEELDPVSENTKIEIATNAKIITTGYQSDVRIFYAMSNALVFPSYREGFPNVVMQAGAMGLPSIVSDINGCNEIIVENKNGIIIPVKDRQVLFDAMKKLLEDKPLYTNLQNNARSLITERFDQKEIWQILLNEYKMLQNNL